MVGRVYENRGCFRVFMLGGVVYVFSVIELVSFWGGVCVRLVWVLWLG